MPTFEIFLAHHPVEVTYIEADGFYFDEDFQEYSFYVEDELVAVFPREQAAGIVRLLDEECDVCAEYRAAEQEVIQ